MKKILVFAIITFLGFDINAQSVRLDSLISYQDTLSEMPFAKRIYNYNNDGKNTKTIYWDTNSSNGVGEFKVTGIDSFSYNDQGLVNMISKLDLQNGVYVETGRNVLKYDDDGNNTLLFFQAMNSSGNDWIDLWILENIFENGFLLESKNSFKSPSTGIVSPSSRKEYVYDPITGLLARQNSFVNENFAPEEQIISRIDFFYDADGLRERSERYSYDEITSSFLPISILNYMKDEFGNDIGLLSTIIDSNLEETLSARSTSVFNTDIERSQAALPFSTAIQFESPKNIILHSTTEWYDEEWKVNFSTDYYYSGLTGTDDLFSNNDLKIFPNPTTNLINIGNDFLLKNDNSVHVVNQNGVIVHSGKLDEAQINIEHLSGGLYHVILRNGNSISNGKFIKI